MRERGLSPIVATVILIGLTVTAAVPLAYFFSTMYSPARPRRADIQVYAGLVNENIIRFHLQHVGGQNVNDPLDPDKGVHGSAWSLVKPVENTIYCWTFEKPERFRQGDWARAEVQLHGVSTAVGNRIGVKILVRGRGTLYSGEIFVDEIGKIPG